MKVLLLSLILFFVEEKSSVYAADFTDEKTCLLGDPNGLYCSNSSFFQSGEKKIINKENLKNFYKLMQRGIEVLLVKGFLSSYKTSVILSIIKKDHKFYLKINKKKINLKNLNRIEASSKEDKQLYLNNFLIEVDTYNSREILTTYFKELQKNYRSLDL